MTPGEFLNEFGAVANAPGGVQRLREMILQLAVQGKLVEQNSDDEPASELLKKIVVEISERRKFDHDIVLTELTVDLVPDWVCVRLGSICLVERGGSPRPIKSYLTEKSDGLNWIKIGDTIKGSKFITSTKEKIKKEGLKKTRRVFPGDFLLTNSMSFGRPYITQIEGCIHDGWLRISPPSQLNKDYLYILLSSPYVKAFFSKAAAGGVVQNLNADKVRELPLPIPPLEEQKRIVAKVDQLMALCDQLETQQQKRSKLVKHARISALEALANAQRGEELQTAWKRVEENLHMLFEHPEDVEDLKKCILQNAVMGKLVPQNPDDEPASELLKKIAKEKAELIEKGEIKRQNPLPEIRDDEKPFEISAGWEWCRLGIISLLITSGSRGWAKYYSNEGASFLRMGNLSKNSFKMRLNTIQCVTPPNNSEGERTSLRENDLLISITGDVGMLGLIPEKFGEAYINQHIAVLRSSKQLFFLYVPYFCLSPLAQEQFSAPQRGIKNSFRLSDVGEMVLPLPPLEEQKRIVEKTQFLLSLCDTLQKQLAKSRKVAEQLAQFIVESITGISKEKMDSGWMEEPEKAGITIAEDQADQE